ncbi:MAG: hypothetical protein JWO10_911, partial [Microbacteriaceae bacterium]|nr:hypothetical protein [Microbacteriaceae bacterium]
LAGMRRGTAAVAAGGRPHARAGAAAPRHPTPAECAVDAVSAIGRGHLVRTRPSKFECTCDPGRERARLHVDVMRDHPHHVPSRPLQLIAPLNIGEVHVSIGAVDLTLVLDRDPVLHICEVWCRNVAAGGIPHRVPDHWLRQSRPANQESESGLHRRIDAGSNQRQRHPKLFHAPRCGPQHGVEFGERAQWMLARHQVITRDDQVVERGATRELRPGQSRADYWMPVVSPPRNRPGEPVPDDASCPRSRTWHEHAHVESSFRHARRHRNPVYARGGRMAEELARRHPRFVLGHEITGQGRGDSHSAVRRAEIRRTQPPGRDACCASIRCRECARIELVWKGSRPHSPMVADAPPSAPSRSTRCRCRPGARSGNSTAQALARAARLRNRCCVDGIDTTSGAHSVGMWWRGRRGGARRAGRAGRGGARRAGRSP